MGVKEAEAGAAPGLEARRHQQHGRTAGRTAPGMALVQWANPAACMRSHAAQYFASVSCEYCSQGPPQLRAATCWFASLCRTFSQSLLWGEGSAACKDFNTLSMRRCSKWNNLAPCRQRWGAAAAPAGPAAPSTATDNRQHRAQYNHFRTTPLGALKA